MARQTLGPLGFVPTMGALHAGHMALLAAAQADGLPVAASIFVNPAQFGHGDDFARYPRDEAGDLARLRDCGCALAWLPDVETMYPPQGATMVHVNGPALHWEGAARPGHFAGVATVVAKLFGQLRPAVAYFGEKDWQQVQVVSRMVADLHQPVRIQPVPTVREADGLALSSRNAYLNPEERKTAPALYAALQHAAAAIVAGKEVAATLHHARHEVALHGMVPDYIALVQAQTLEPLAGLARPARLIAAVKLGAVRLLDNVGVG